ncbi:hypothetical protein GPALN_007820 [Globodera pallida]|nr:hypothetical protein GPALN_007820 [Globodera pallida]
MPKLSSIRTQILGIFLLGSFASALPILQQSYANDPSPLITNDAGISISAVDCAALPPALLCAKFVRTKCGTTNMCSKHDNTVRYKPLHITLLYESLCPYSQRFIKDTMFDVYNRFRSHVKFELVPYGNAKNNGTQFSCQHGADECRINKFQSCAINYMQDPVPFVYCLETLLYDNVTFEEASKLCFNLINPGNYVHDRIMQCFDKSEGDTLQTLAALKTQMIWPNKHQFVPWIVVNNVSIESMQFLRYSIPALICESRADGEYVAECESW